MNVTEHVEAIDAALDALATDPDVSEAEYERALNDLSRRIITSRNMLAVPTWNYKTSTFDKEVTQ